MCSEGSACSGFARSHPMIKPSSNDPMIKPFARNPLQIIAETYNRPELLEMALAKPPAQGPQRLGGPPFVR